MVIELAGLPGAGKSSIVAAITVPYLGRGQISNWNVPLDLRVARAAFRVALSARPLTLRRMTRVIGLMIFLRHYRREHNRSVVVDQGLVQKLWSMLIESDEYSHRRLEDLVKRLAPYAADHLVWIDIPASVAAERIGKRVAGNSRFDGRPVAETSLRLTQFEGLYYKIIELFEKHTRSRVLILRGDDSVSDNARKITALIESDVGRGG